MLDELWDPMASACAQCVTQSLWDGLPNLSCRICSARALMSRRAVHPAAIPCDRRSWPLLGGQKTLLRRRRGDGEVSAFRRSDALPPVELPE